MNQKYKRLVGDLGIFALGSLGSKIVLFLLLPIYTHVLTDSEYGIADLVFTMGDLLLPFISLAMYNGLLRYGLMKGRRQNSLLITFIVFIIGSIAAVVLTPIIGLYPAISDWKWYLCAHVIVHFARNSNLVYLKVKDKNKAYALLSIAQALMLVGFNILFLIVFKMGIQGYLLSTILSNAILALFSFIIGGMASDLKEAKLDKPLLGEMITYSVPFIFNDVSWWVIHSSDKIMIELMINSSMLGLYTAASKIPSLVNAFTGIFSQAWGLASIKEYDSTNDSTFYSNVFNYFSAAVFGVTIVLISIIQPFMKIYVGSAFIESWHYVPLLLISAAFGAISTFAGSMFGAIKKSKPIMTSTLIAGLVNLIINYLLIPILGVNGAVIGTVTAYFCVALIRLIDLMRITRIKFNLTKVAALSCISLFQATLVGSGIHVYLVSIAAVIIFLLIARNDIIRVIKIMKKKFVHH